MTSPSSPIRTPFVAGNWKMHLLTGSGRELARALTSSPLVSQARVVLFPSFPLLEAIATELSGTPIDLGGQDLHAEDQGAHTGDVSGAQLHDVGCRYVLCGHSERRRDHGESDAEVAGKVAAASRADLVPVLCLGETLQQREEERTREVLARQLGAATGAVAGGLVLAYEPVWAIGTGRSATPELAQDAHAFLRERLEEELGAERARSTTILYGGSVNPGNAADLAAQPDVDGFLVGGASLDPASFLDIIEGCISSRRSQS